ncbi:hypothetical protein AMTR_s00130p00058680 [Amborella trichopoda]|uniref:Uncharacterized protein n=1 Tax=Amborella trichopoda TaxID=13333 RepID=W1NS82_AMBTC|nr:hypothetical protein AMTR_s00130p00058680 [Amborella trichopoda]
MDSIQDSVKESKAEAHKSNLRKEPSFSRWCDEDGLERSNGLAKDAEIRGEDADFELPSPKSEHESKTVGREREANHLVVERENEPLSPSFRQRSVAHLNGSHNSLHFSHGSFSDRGDMEHMTLRDENGGIGKRYASLEVESEHGKMLSSGLWVTTGREPDSSAPNIEEREQRGISAVSLIRTLIYILVWYTFSTFLTL